MVLSPIIRSAYTCIYSIWYLSHRYCYLPLSWKSWNRFECAVDGASCWIYIGILLAHPILHISRIRVKIRGAMPTVLMISRCEQENLQIHFTSRRSLPLQQDGHKLLSRGCLGTSLRNQAITPTLCCAAFLGNPSYAYMTWQLSVQHHQTLL
jgi:hypothetical protein